MQAQQANIKLLIQKIDSENGIQQIRLRSINTLHTKVTLKVLPIETIHIYSELPGALMKWINAHYEKKSEHLYKVLTILTYFAKNQKGLFILKQYQTLDFLEGLKKYMLKHFSNPEPYLELIEEVLKKLVVISRTVNQNHPQNNQNLQKNSLSSQLNTNEKNRNSSNQSLKQQDSIKISRAEKQKQKTFQRAKQLQIITLNFITRKQCLSETQQKRIFDLTVQLKYGKKQVQFQTLMQIKRFVIFYSKQWFKCKTDLVQQLCLYVEGQHYPWLCCEILNIIFKGLSESQRESNQWQYTIFDSQSCEVTEKQKVAVSFNLKTDEKSIFSSVYSSQILITLAKAARIQQLPFLALIKSHYTFTHFLEILKRLPEEQLQKPNILNAIQYYSGKFKQCNTCLVPYIKQPQKVPNHLRFLKQNKSKFSYDSYHKKYLKGVSYEFKISENLHRISEIVKDLELGVQGINYNPVQIIQNLYVNCFLTIVVAVSKQDPLMSYYPKAKQLILRISVHPYERVRVQLYNTLLRCILDQGNKSFINKSSQKGQHIQYVNKKYLRSQLFEQSLYDPKFLNDLFESSLNQPQTIYCMLQILKAFQSKNSSQQNNLGRYANVLFSLTNYQSVKEKTQKTKIVKQNFSQKISTLASTILSRLPKKFQFKILLMKLFSKDIATRCNMAKQLLSLNKSFAGSSGMDLIQQLVYDTSQNAAKKALKIEQSSLRNFINIAMNPQLDWDIRCQAFQNLINTIQRAQINQSIATALNKFVEGLFPILQDSASNAVREIQKPQQINNASLISICIQLYGLIVQKLRMRQLKIKPNEENTQILPLQGISKLSQQMLICLLSKMVHSQASYPNRTVKYLLKMIYLSVMQSPFTSHPCKHWILDLYPNHDIVKQLLPSQYCNQAVYPCLQYNSNQTISQFQEFEQIIENGLYKNFKSYAQKVISVAVRKNAVLIDVDFALLQKQIMEGIATNSRSSGIDSLNLVAYFLQRIDPSTLPKDSKNITSQLLNSLFVKQNSHSFGFQADVIGVLKQFNTNGVKNSRQIQSLVSPKSSLSTISKLYLLELLVRSGQILSAQQIQDWLIKPMNRYREDEILLFFKIFNNVCLNSLNNSLAKLSQFCQLSLLNSITKCIKVGECSQIKNSAVFLLTKILRNGASNGCQTFFDSQLNLLLGAINEGIFQGTSRQSSISVYTKQFIMGLDCAKRIICKQLNISKITQNSNNEAKSILKSTRIILGKLIILLKKCTTQKVSDKPLNVLRASMFSFMSHLMVNGASQILKQIDVIDIAVGLLSQLKQPIQKGDNTDGKRVHQYLIQVSEVCGFLARWRIIEPQLSQYLVSSTQIIKYLFKLLIFVDSELMGKKCELRLQSAVKTSIEKIAQLFLQLSKKSNEDLFIMQLSKMIKNNQGIIPQNNFFTFLAKFCSFGGREYLKMFSWFIVIEWKGRAVLDDQYEKQQESLGQKLMQTYIQKKSIYLGSSLVAMSFGAKKALIESEYFIQLVKKVQNFIDLKVVQGMKNKKKGIKAETVSRIVQDDQTQRYGSSRNTRIPEINLQDNSQIKNILLLLCSLFHSPKQKLETLNSLKVPKPLGKRLFSVIQKLYAYMINGSDSYDENPQDHQRISNFFIKMITNLCQSRQLGQFFSGQISESNSFILQDVCNTIIKSQLLLTRYQKTDRGVQSSGSTSNVKQALHILGLLAKHQTARNMISRMKIIEELSGRICRLIQDPRKDVINADSLQQLYWVMQFYVQLSQFKDTNSKIMMDKRILQAFIAIMTSEKFTFHLLQKETLHLMQNLACFKQSKSLFLSNRQIHKINLYLLEQSTKNRDSVGGQQENQVSKIILTMIYNMVYKSSAALKIYKRSEVIELIKSSTQVDTRACDQRDDIFEQLKQCLLEALNQ